MQTRNIFKNRLLTIFFVAGICVSNTAKAQTDTLKDSVMALPADDGQYDKTFTKV